MDIQASETVPGPSVPDGDGDTATPLQWPPPGLSRLQGDVYNAARWLAAGAFLILPLLWAVVAEQEPWSLGPFGDSIWLVFLFGIAGIPVVLGGYIILWRLLRRAAQAVDRGHHWWVVALVATDHRRDAGLLLQGAHAYRPLSEGGRNRLANARLLVGGLSLLSVLWFSLGFGVSVVLAARGGLGPWGVAVSTLGPSAAAGLAALVLYLWEERLLRGLRKRFYNQSWSKELVAEEIRGWQQAMSDRLEAFPSPEALAENGGRAGTVFRTSYVGIAVATFAAFVPVFTLVFSAAMIPVMADISVPEFDRTVRQFASVEPLRAFTLPADPGVTPLQAGEILHGLSFVGRPYRATEGVLPPAEGFETPWFPAATPPGSSPAWIEDVIERIGQPLTAAERERLAPVASHPAHAAVARLARAPALDIVGVRWSLPLPSGTTMAELSMPTVGRLRNAAHGHLALAAVQASEGRLAAADTTIREVISVGLLMADEGPTVLDNLIGIVVAGMGGDALEALYRNTDYGDAAALAWGLESAEASAERARAPMARDVESLLRTMPERTLDSAFVRGVRWQYVGLLNTLGPCINLRRVVFGPDAAYRRWLQTAEARLVRYPAEAELFEIARGGLLGRAPDPMSLSTRVLALTMGGADEPGSCARVLGEVVGF